MNLDTHHGSATIYQFPLGGRAGLLENRAAKSAIDAISARANEAAIGESWYHAAAVQDAKRNGDH